MVHAADENDYGQDDPGDEAEPERAVLLLPGGPLNILAGNVGRHRQDFIAGALDCPLEHGEARLSRQEFYPGPAGGQVDGSLDDTADSEQGLLDLLDTGGADNALDRDFRRERTDLVPDLPDLGGEFHRADELRIEDNSRRGRSCPLLSG